MSCLNYTSSLSYLLEQRCMWYMGHCGHNGMVVEFTTTVPMQPVRILFMARCSRYNNVCRCLETGLWFSPGTPVSSTTKTDCHDIAEIVLKLALTP